jgi:hypothetical protein
LRVWIDYIKTIDGMGIKPQSMWKAFTQQHVTDGPPTPDVWFIDGKLVRESDFEERGVDVDVLVAREEADVDPWRHDF